MLIRLKRKMVAGIGLALWLLLATMIFAPAHAANTYSFGVLNQQPPAATAELWNPILRYVREKTGISLRLRMGPTVQDTDRMTAAGVFDFLYSNHNFDPRFGQADYQPIAKWGGHPLVGQIVVLADSPLKTLGDLQGKRVAFPSRDAFIAYRVTMYELKAKGISVIPVFGATQAGTAVMLEMAGADAASLNKLFADQFQARNSIRFRVLYQSEDWPNIPVLAHHRVPAEVTNAVRQTLVQMAEDPEGKALLRKLSIPGFLPAANSDYDSTRRLYQEAL